LSRSDGPGLSAAAVKSRHCVREASELIHVLPGNPDMPRRERQILSSFMLGRDIHSAYERASLRIGELYRSALDDFDIILIDCPPGLTLFSEAAIRAADGLLIPTLPNEISFAAIDHLRTELARTRPERSLEDLLVGTVISKLRRREGDEHYRYQSRSIENLLDRAAPGFQILKPYLPYCRELEAAAWRDDDVSCLGFAQRYGQSSQAIEQLAREFACRCAALLMRSQATQSRAEGAQVKCPTF